LAGLAAYHGGFGGPFVFDDVGSIVENPTIRHLGPGALRPPPGGLTVSGRPLLNLSLAFNYAIGGPAVGSYHALNLAIHLLAGLTLLGIVRRALRPRPEADALGFAVALLWTLHPLQTEAVLYVVQRAESLMGLCYLLTLYGFIRATEPGASAPRRWFAVSWLACLAGMATKEVMVSAPVLVLLYDRAFVAGSFRAAWRRRRGFYLALAGTWILLAALVAGTGGNRGGTSGFGIGVGWVAYWLTQGRALPRYVALVFWPHPLVFDYEPFWITRWTEVIPGGALVLGGGALTIWALWRRPRLGFLGAWFFAILAPTSLLPGGIQMIAEHRMYLPLAAVLTGVVLALWRGLGPRAGLVLCLAAAVAAGVATARRTEVYRSALALWGDTAARRPGNAFAQNNLGRALFAAGRVDEAAARYAAALQADPTDALAHYNLANILSDRGRLPEAIGEYRRALALNPGLFEAHNNLGLALARADRMPEAIAEYEATLRLQPDSFEAQANLADLLAQSGQFAASLGHYRAALRLQPGNAGAHENLGLALAQTDQVPAAIAEFQAAVRLAPGDPELHANLGLALQHAGRTAEAQAEFAAAARLGPPNGVDKGRP
jgi:tetratricopeptide (TPR) repeat protein